MSGSSVKIILSVSHYHKISIGKPFCAFFQKIFVSEKFIDMSGGKYQDFCVGNLLSHSAEIIRSGIP